MFDGEIPGVPPDPFVLKAMRLGTPLGLATMAWLAWKSPFDWRVYSWEHRLQIQ